MADKIIKHKISLRPEDVLKASLELRKALMRKLQNRKVIRRSAEAYLEELSGEECIPSEYIEGWEEGCVIVDADNIPTDCVFEILTEAEGELSEGSVVHKDITEQFKNDLPLEERGKIIVVAKPSDSLRCIYLQINYSTEKIEVITDGGSQIVAIDSVVAMGINLLWDPDTTIHMQSANGQL